MARCLDGDAGAFEALVEAYQKPFFTSAYRLLGNDDEARDATQSAFIKVHGALQRFDPTRRFFSWAYRILVNECLNLQRARRPHEPLRSDLATVDGPDRAFESAEHRRRLQAAILALPPDSRAVIVLKHFAGMSYDEIAATLEIPVKTVRSRLHTARVRLMDLVSREGARG